MRHLRRLTGPLAALVLLVPVLVLVAAPAAAQDDQTPKVYPLTLIKLGNDMTRAPDNNNDGDPDQKWQVQIAVEPLGGCTPSRGNGHYTTFWLDIGDETPLRLSLEECVFRLSARARDGLRPGCRHGARLGWGDPAGTYTDDSILTSDPDRPSENIRLSLERNTGRGCTVTPVTNFVLDGAGTVVGMPGGGADPTLAALVRRAAAVAEFRVRVEPDPAAGAPRRDCDDTLEFTLRGDGTRSPHTVADVLSGECPMRASIIAAPAHFEIVAGAAVTFDGAAPNLLVDLGSLVRLPPARIAIVQNVRDSGNRGAVGYNVSRACGTTTVAGPAPASDQVVLHEGRFTVHAPALATFGPTYVYPVAATGDTSQAVAGCSVTVAISGVPSGCAVHGSHSRTLTWSAADPVEHFDFEFDIYCGDAVPPAAPPDDGSGATEPDPGDVATGGAEVRIVARKLAGGKIEFGLEQRGHDGAWGDRRYPRARLFPAGAAVGRWLYSSPITLSVAASADSFDEEIPVRITARRLSNGKVEFGLQQRIDGSWSDRMLPRLRNFPPTAAVGNWLGSSTLTVGG